MQDRIQEQLTAAGMALEASQIDTLAKYLELLQRWNAVHNLTAITDTHEMIRRHLLESLALRPYLKGTRIADVGSGARLPGVPLAITELERQFALIESRAKRARFLRHVKGALHLANITVEHCRVEHLTHVPSFDTVLARAVAPLPELLKLTAHLLSSESVLLVPTGSDPMDEADILARGYRVRRAGGPMAERLRGHLLVVEKADD